MTTPQRHRGHTETQKRSFRMCAVFLWQFCGSVVLAMVLGSQVAEAFGFSVEPSRVQVAVPAGKRRGQTLTVKNARKDSAIHLTVYVLDVVFLPDGTQEFPPSGSTDWSCAQWVQFTPAELNIPPNSTQEVRVSVTTPPEATGGHYAMLFFETGPSYDEQGIGVNFRVGALVEAVVPGTEQYDAALKALTMTPPATVEADLFNGGNVLIRPRGRVKIFEAGGRKIRDVVFNPNALSVLPKTLRRLTTTLQEPLPSGAYQVRVEIDYGARTLIVGERSAEVP